jgi:hypothetical protein
MVVLRAVNLRLGLDGFISPPKKDVLMDFIAVKNPFLSARFQPASLWSNGKHVKNYTNLSLIWIIFLNPVLTSKKTQYFSTTKISWVIRFKEITLFILRFVRNPQRRSVAKRERYWQWMFTLYIEVPLGSQELIECYHV